MQGRLGGVHCCPWVASGWGRGVSRDGLIVQREEGDRGEGLAVFRLRVVAAGGTLGQVT